jgi:glycosyltransferase involved in cell wall biosynthesis
MRIVIVTEQYLPMLGGVAMVTHHLSQDLAAAGHQVWVVAPSEGHYNKYTHEGPVHVSRFASFEWPTYDGQRIAFPPVAPLRRLMAGVRPDIVHIHSPVVLGTLAQLLAGTLHIPVVGTNHYMPINMSPSLSTDPLLGKSFEALAYSYLLSFYNRCEFVTAPTETALDLLRQHGLRAPSRAISNGIDISGFFPASRDEALRRRYGLPADRPLLFYLGRLSEEKRVHVLLDAMTQLSAPAHLAIGGSGPARAELEARADALSIRSRVTFLGHVPDEDLASTYRLADIFVMPSVAELQSVATLEAMAVGKPAVVARAGALPELVRDGENGYLFTPDDSRDLSECLAPLVADEALRGRMGAQSLQRVAAHDRRRVLDEWQQLYADLAAQARAAARVRMKRSLESKVDRKLPVRKTAVPTTARLRSLVLDRVHEGEQRKGTRPSRRRKAKAAGAAR